MTTVSRPHGGVDASVSRPSRGTMFSVFQDLDEGGDGRVTYSMFEAVALDVGWKEDMARRLFDKLDATSKGYATVADWGGPEVETALGEFTRLYCQRKRGEGGRYKDAPEIKDLWSAMQMALARLKLKNHGRNISHDKIAAAFEFIDHNNSGTLDKAELYDAFNGLGVYVTADVLTQAMASLDKDGNGTVDYSEFVLTLFPVIGKSYKFE
jgi:Ca2+-binding EF-hand superfamily protein